MSLSYRAAAGILAALKASHIDALAEAADELGAEIETLDLLTSRFAATQRIPTECGAHEMQFLSWTLAKVGPRLGMTCPAFESLVREKVGTDADFDLVMPKWVLGMPVKGALERRFPSIPVVDIPDDDVFLAYKGLLDHLLYLGDLEPCARTAELLNSPIPWRIVAIADRLEPERDREDSIGPRLGRLRHRTVDDSQTTETERRWWKLLDAELLARRHTLSHLSDTDKWPFRRCIDEMWSLETAVSATAGIGLAVMASIASSIRDGDPPTTIFGAIIDKTAWLDNWIGEHSA